MHNNKMFRRLPTNDWLYVSPLLGWYSPDRSAS